MPVRFQVDGDFYDHPKTIGMSDGAVALWTRAGSYATAKRTDGFIADHVLAAGWLSRTPEEAAEELVDRGLWKRVTGGYKFHQWGQRNLTKSRIEAFTGGARDRKRLQRKRDKEAENSQVETGNVTDPVTRDISDGHADVTPLSLSLSSSVSLPPNPQRGKRSGDHNSDPLFARFWTVYPQKAAKPAAHKAWLKALDRGADPETIIRAAARYRDDPWRKPDKTKYPQGWLNDERYNDQPLDASQETQQKTYWTPPAPPREIADDPEKFSEWWAEQLAQRGAS